MRAKLQSVLAVLMEFFLRPFQPMIKKVKRIKGLRKAFKITGKIIKIVISLANIGISGYKFYDGFLKDKLNKDKDKEVTSA